MLAGWEVLIVLCSWVVRMIMVGDCYALGEDLLVYIVNPGLFQEP